LGKWRRYYCFSTFQEISKWSLIFDESALNLSDNDDYAKTVSTAGGRFEARDIDGEVIWRSEWIDISDFEKVDVELTASETGSGANTETKYLKVFYRLDDGEEIPFSENSENAGNWGSAIVSSKRTGRAIHCKLFVTFPIIMLPTKLFWMKLLLLPKKNIILRHNQVNYC
jgi:hypothetical protein